jgi:signal peptidase II
MEGLDPKKVATVARRHWQLLLLVSGTAVVGDQLSKALILDRLSSGEQVQILGPLSLTHVENSGVAFGLFAGSTTLISTMSAVVVLWLLFSFARSQLPGRLAAGGYALVLGGTASNLADRLRLGQVTDFITLPHWPTFNLADSCICVGMALLVILFVRREILHSRA